MSEMQEWGIPQLEKEFGLKRIGGQLSTRDYPRAKASLAKWLRQPGNKHRLKKKVFYDTLRILGEQVLRMCSSNWIDVFMYRVLAVLSHTSDERCSLLIRSDYPVTSALSRSTYDGEEIPWGGESKGRH
uniref:Uncharacterized protein n=1 Tax=Moniliophthora roreri TaxID=221103 RepID=A0A0W0F5C6_MONRR